MKNVVKKIASIAMACTLLGTGSAVTKTISPKSSCILTADAARFCREADSTDYEVHSLNKRKDYFMTYTKVDGRKSPNINAPIEKHFPSYYYFVVTGREVHRQTYHGYYSDEMWVQARYGGWVPVYINVYYTKPDWWGGSFEHWT